MSQVIQGQVVKTERKPNKSGNGERYIVTFADSQGFEKEWTTFDLDLANKAANLKGGAATLTGEVNKNGKYTNYDLIDVEAGGATLDGSTQELGSSPSKVSPGTQTTGNPGSSLPLAKDNSAAETARIVRGNAVNATGALLSGTGATKDEFLETYSWIVRLINEGSSAVTTATPSTPDEVAEQVNEIAPGAVQVGVDAPEDDGIPY